MAGQSRRVKVNVDSARFKRGMRKVSKNFNARSRGELERTGHNVRNYAVRYSPVDTGFLKGSWTVTMGEDSRGPYCKVQNSAPYAAEIEVGGSYTSSGRRREPQPMIRPAIAEVLGLRGIGYNVNGKSD